MKSNPFMTVVLVLQSLTLVVLLSGGMPTAMAQIPDAGAQRERQLDEMKRIGDRLDRMVALLESGKLEVRVKNADQR